MSGFQVGDMVEAAAWDGLVRLAVVVDIGDGPGAIVRFEGETNNALTPCDTMRPAPIEAGSWVRHRKRGMGEVVGMDRSYNLVVRFDTVQWTVSAMDLRRVVTPEQIASPPPSPCVTRVSTVLATAHNPARCSRCGAPAYHGLRVEECSADCEARDARHAAEVERAMRSAVVVLERHGPEYLWVAGYLADFALHPTADGALLALRAKVEARVRRAT